MSDTITTEYTVLDFLYQELDLQYQELDIELK